MLQRSYAITVLGFSLGMTVWAQPYTTYVTIPTSNSIQTSLISTIPTGAFTVSNLLKTTFNIPSTPTTCGYAGNGPCNFYDGFGFSGSGQSITMNVMIPKPTLVYTLANAYAPAFGQQLATIEFVGSSGTTETFPLVAGQNIRDFYHGNFANTLTNGIPGVVATAAYTCEDPSTCLGAGGTGDVNTGLTGHYVVDEQEFALDAAFADQHLTQVIITDTYDGSVPILLGVTVMSEIHAPPRVSGFTPSSGGPGTFVTIEGANFLGATGVTFNGAPAGFKVNTVRQVAATVPPGATSGPVAVTTPYGTATSVSSFTVN